VASLTSKLLLLAVDCKQVLLGETPPCTIESFLARYRIGITPHSRTRAHHRGVYYKCVSNIPFTHQVTIGLSPSVDSLSPASYLRYLAYPSLSHHGPLSQGPSASGRQVSRWTLQQSFLSSVAFPPADTLLQCRSQPTRRHVAAQIADHGCTACVNMYLIAQVMGGRIPIIV
jgi:hypothetical protein